MPRVKDVAWKFVTRLEGEKWRCPHCETEYSGKVTRVKSHFLKHRNKGISPCKKVPEHISTLMELSQNQVDNKEDIAWKFVDRLEDNKWRCHYCRDEFFGDLTGVKGHLLKVPNEGNSVCTEVPGHVRTLMQSLLDEVAEEESREVAQEQSREAHGQSSVEPKSRDMPTQAEVAEEESRGANCQFPTEPESRDTLPPDVLWSPQSLELVKHLFLTPEGELQEPLPMQSPAQNSHGMFT
ncbi:hypothetical protein ACJRO7_022982 [Eucalyptus globulus]|uniref:BED-type domain-containing protein n=1 Tax=Eucalyptus globulus TaxID=34317 RepID=A0ABD3KD61_EUCGL